MVEKKKSWIKRGASKHPGLFAEKAKRAGKSTAEFATEHYHDSGKLGEEARFAANAMKENPHRVRAKAHQNKLYRKD